MRFESYGWHVQIVADGNTSDTAALEAAIAAAKLVTDRPSMIKVKTTIGLGSGKEGTHKVHGSPLGDEDLAQVKTRFGFDPTQKFVVPDAVRQVYAGCLERGNVAFTEW